MTLERSLSAIAFLLLVGFLGILVWHVPRLDLTIVLAFTLLLAAYDLFLHKAK